jgi:hypothetical protein
MLLWMKTADRKDKQEISPVQGGKISAEKGKAHENCGSLALAHRGVLSFSRSFLTRPEVVGACALSANRRRAGEAPCWWCALELLLFIRFLFMFKTCLFHALYRHIRKLNFLSSSTSIKREKIARCEGSFYFSSALFLLFLRVDDEKSCNAGKILNFSSLCTVCCYVYQLPIYATNIAMQLKLRNFSLTSDGRSRDICQ